MCARTIGEDQLVINLQVSVTPTVMGAMVLLTATARRV